MNHPAHSALSDVGATRQAGTRYLTILKGRRYLAKDKQ